MIPPVHDRSVYPQTGNNVANNNSLSASLSYIATKIKLFLSHFGLFTNTRTREYLISKIKISMFCIFAAKEKIKAFPKYLNEEEGTFTKFVCCINAQGNFLDRRINGLNNDYRADYKIDHQIEIRHRCHKDYQELHAIIVDSKGKTHDLSNILLKYKLSNQPDIDLYVKRVSVACPELTKQQLDNLKLVLSKVQEEISR